MSGRTLSHPCNRCDRSCISPTGSNLSDVAAPLAIGEPPVPGRMQAAPRRLDELGREPLDPPVDGDVAHGDAALSQQFLDIPVRQAIAQVPADRDRDYLPRKPVQPANTADLPDDVT